MPASRSRELPTPTFVAIAHGWASGQSFATVVEDEELSGGDFVRTMKQLIDLLRQLALLAFEDDTRESARVAAERLFRGVVAASTAIDLEDDDEDDHEEDGAGEDALRSPAP